MQKTPGNEIFSQTIREPSPCSSPQEYAPKDSITETETLPSPETNVDAERLSALCTSLRSELLVVPNDLRKSDEKILRQCARAMWRPEALAKMEYREPGLYLYAQSGVNDVPPFDPLLERKIQLRMDISTGELKQAVDNDDDDDSVDEHELDVARYTSLIHRGQQPDPGLVKIPRLNLSKILRGIVEVYIKHRVKKLSLETREDWPVAGNMQELLKECHTFCAKLALTMLTHDSMVADTTKPEYQFLFQAKETQGTSQARLLRRWFVLQVAPLRRLSETQWQFAHALLWEYYYAQAVVAELCDSPYTDFREQIVGPLIQYLGYRRFTQVQALLQLHAETLSNNPTMQQGYIEVVLASRQRRATQYEDNILTTAASNAISVLNYASLSGMWAFRFREVGNWSGIRVPSANLNNAQILYCNFDRADLSHTTMLNAVLIGTTLREANLTGVKLRLSRVFRYHTNDRMDRPTDLAIGPDGTMLATSGYKYGVILTNFDTWNPSKRTVSLQDDDPFGTVVSFSADGKSLVIGTRLGQFYELNPSNGRRRRDPTSVFFEAHIHRLRYSPYNPVIAATLNHSSDIHLVSSRTFERKNRLDNREIVMDFVFSPDRISLASASFGGIRIWDLATSRCIHHLTQAPTCATAVCYNKDGTKLFGGTAGGAIVLWDVQAQPEPKQIGMLRGHRQWITSMHLSFDGQQLASASKDYTIRIWHLEASNPLCVAVLRGHTHDISRVFWHPSKPLLASVSEDRSVRVWDISQPIAECLPPQDGCIAALNTSVVNHRGTLLATASSTETWVRLWDMRTMALTGILRGHTNSVTCLCFSPDDEYLVSGSQDQTLRIWRVDTGECLGIISGQQHGARGLCFAHDGKSLLSSSKSTVCVWNFYSIVNNPKQAEQQRPIRSFDHDHLITAMSLDATSTKLAICSSYGQVEVVDFNTGSRLYSDSRVYKQTHAIRFAPDGQRLACTDGDEVYIIDAEKGKRLRKLSVKDEHSPLALAWTSDGRFLAADYDDQSIAVWDSASGSRVALLEQQLGQDVASLCFTSEDSILVSGSKHGTLCVWSIAYHEGNGLAATLNAVVGSSYGPNFSRTNLTGAIIDEELRKLSSTAFPHAIMDESKSDSCSIV